MRTVIITGASKGIGRATAERFIASGANVINLSRTPCPVEGVRNHRIDLTEPSAEGQIRKLAKGEIADGELTLVHNAATLVNDTVADTSANALRKVIEINLVAPQILNHALIPKMGEGSSIIYVGSTLSEKAVANTYTYVTTKHAMVGMMRATCQDLSGSGIHTACVCPGFTDTEMLRAHVGDDPAVLEQIGSASTFGRLVEPSEIAAAICFIADNPVVNGAVIHANLGQIES